MSEISLLSSEQEPSQPIVAKSIGYIALGEGHDADVHLAMDGLRDSVASTMNQTSKELVPFSYDRESYNLIHGTEFTAHNDHLSAEQARQINQDYDVEVHVGRHGAAVEQPRDRMDYGLLPTQKEYEAVAKVVNGMSIGDVLFVEGNGMVRFREPENLVRKSMNALSKAIAAQADPDRVDLLEGALRSTQRQLDDEAKETEMLREGYQIHAFSYGIQLAYDKGITIMYADHDKFDKTARKTHAEYVKESGSDTEAAVHRQYSARDKKATNILKDYALEHPDPAPVTDEEGVSRKPRLVMVFGSGHKDSITSNFSNLGLDAKIVQMPSSSDDERMDEQIDRMAADLRDRAAA